MAHRPTLALGTWVAITDTGSYDRSEWYCETHDHTVTLARGALARVVARDVYDPDEYVDLLALDGAGCGHRLPNMRWDWFAAAAAPTGDEEAAWCLALLSL